MKAKITRGKGFKGLLDYVFDVGALASGNKQPELVGGNMAGANPSQLSREFNAVQKLRPDIEKPVWHCSLSLPLCDNANATLLLTQGYANRERLSARQWQKISTDFMERMGFNEYIPYTAVRHNDKEYDHIHIIASRIGGDSHLWYGQHEVYQAIAITQELEKIYNLTPTKGFTQTASRKSLTYKERHQAERTGTPAPREQLQLEIDHAIADCPTAVQFAQRLEQAGVGVRASLASAGKMNGFSFEWEGIAFKGSSLGKAYSISGLLSRGLTYDPKRDAMQLERYRQPIAKQSPSQFKQNESADITVSTESVMVVEGVLHDNTIGIVNHSPAPTAEDIASQVIDEESVEAVIPVENEVEIPTESQQEVEVQDIAPQLVDIAVEAVIPVENEVEIPTESLQETWVKDIAPQLVDILNEFQTSTYRGKYRTIEYDMQRNQLSLKANETGTVLLTAYWNQEKQQWEDNGSSLTHEEYDSIVAGLYKWQQSQPSKGVER